MTCPKVKSLSKIASPPPDRACVFVPNPGTSTAAEGRPASQQPSTAGQSSQESGDTTFAAAAAASGSERALKRASTMPPTAENLSNPTKAVLASQWHHQHQQQQQQQQAHAEEHVALSSASNHVTSSPHKGASGLHGDFAAGPSERRSREELAGGSGQGEKASKMNTSSGSSTSTTMLESFTSDSSVASEFFRKEPCIYTHRMFQRAAQIFASLRHNSDSDHSSPVRRKPVSVKEPASRPVPPMDFTDTTEKKLTYELAFATLKCKYFCV